MDWEENISILAIMKSPIDKGNKETITNGSEFNSKESAENPPQKECQSKSLIP